MAVPLANPTEQLRVDASPDAEFERQTLTEDGEQLTVSSEQGSEAREPIAVDREPVTVNREPLPETAHRPLPTANSVTQKDEALLEVERIMENGLAEVYGSLPDSAKPIFKKKGEEVAASLTLMVRSMNIQFKRALQLIRDWLLTIPKVNKFFLEQEAKIKVDELKALVEERKHDLSK